MPRYGAVPDGEQRSARINGFSPYVGPSRAQRTIQTAHALAVVEQAHDAEPAHVFVWELRRHPSFLCRGESPRRPRPGALPSGLHLRGCPGAALPLQVWAMAYRETSPEAPPLSHPELFHGAVTVHMFLAVTGFCCWL